MRKVVPERITQIMSNGNHGVRRLTPDRMTIDALGSFIEAEQSQAVSSLQVERSGVLDRGSVVLTGVMY